MPSKPVNTLCYPSWIRSLYIKVCPSIHYHRLPSHSLHSFTLSSSFVVLVIPGIIYLFRGTERKGRTANTRSDSQMHRDHEGWLDYVQHKCISSRKHLAGNYLYLSLVYFIFILFYFLMFKSMFRLLIISFR